MSRKNLMYLLVAVAVVVTAFASMAVVSPTAKPVDSGRMPEVVVVADAPVTMMDTVVVTPAAVVSQ